MAEKISGEDLKSRKDEFVIIDVREADEIESGKIEGSINMPLGLTIRNAKKKQIEDMRGKKICTYCGTGEKGRCTKYLCHSHCSMCNLKFRKFFKLLDSKGKSRTYVMLKEERE